MSRRCLFGPVTPEFADQNLHYLRQSGDCLAFDHAGAADLAIGPGDTWASVCSRLPSGWQPDCVVLHMPYTTIPQCLWSAPVPLVAWAGDWNLLWHGYRHWLRYCDLVLADVPGADVMMREGITPVRTANFYGCQRSFLEAMPIASQRDIDVLFVGRINVVTQGERHPWLARIARLGERWQVGIHHLVFGDAYRELLARSRIVFNRSVRGECNMRAFEAAASGALLFQEEENRETQRYFRDRQECVYYTADNLEALLTYYLEHEDERRRIAGAAQACVSRYSFTALWADVVALLEEEWPALVERCRRRPTMPAHETLVARCWQALSSYCNTDLSLAADLNAAGAANPADGMLPSAHALINARTERRPEVTRVAVAEAAAGDFRRSLESRPTHVLTSLNLAEALALAGQKQPAIDQAYRSLAVLDRQATFDVADLDEGHFLPVFDTFRVEWERAAWQNVGRPAAEADVKMTLLRWRLHFLLSSLKEGLGHHYEAALARPDLCITRVNLGCALLGAGHAGGAIEHLRRALAIDPFDKNAPRALILALRTVGDTEGQARLIQDRRLLAQAAPQVVPLDAWFDKPPAAPH